MWNKLKIFKVFQGQCLSESIHIPQVIASKEKCKSIFYFLQITDSMMCFESVEENTQIVKMLWKTVISRDFMN